LRRINSDTPHAVEMAREGVPLIVIQRQLGHSNLGITSMDLQGIDSGEIVETVQARRAPVIPVSAALRLRSTARAGLVVAPGGYAALSA
jgi:hypothetical protein